MPFISWKWLRVYWLPCSEWTYRKTQIWPVIGVPYWNYHLVAGKLQLTIGRK